MKKTLTLLTTLLSISLAAQTALNGLIVDADDGAPIEGANVYLSSGIQNFQKTNRQGMFYFEEPGTIENHHELRFYIYKPDYEPIDAAFRAPMTTIKMKRKKIRGFYVHVKDRATELPIENAEVRFPDGRIETTDQFGMVFVDVSPNLNMYEPIELAFGKGYDYRRISQRTTFKAALDGFQVHLSKNVLNFEQLEYKFSESLNDMLRMSRDETLTEQQIFQLVELYEKIRNFDIPDYEQRKVRDEYYEALSPFIEALYKSTDPRRQKAIQKLAKSHKDALDQLNEARQSYKQRIQTRPTVGGIISDVEIILNFGRKVLELKVNLQELGLDYSSEILEDAKQLKGFIEEGKQFLDLYESKISAPQKKRMTEILEAYTLRIEQTLTKQHQHESGN